MSKIIITVAGQTGLGKSTIAQQISAQLEAIGLSVTLNNPDVRRDSESHLRAMASIKEHGLEIEINEEQLPRE